MPLKAIINNKEYISSFLSLDEWISLKNEIKTKNLEVLISQTSKRGYLRISKNGLKHFVHKKGEKPEFWKPESLQHLKAKNEILLGCLDAGWNSSPEYIKSDWIADVFASNTAMSSKLGIAFEVQWSSQTAEETINRQDKYNISNVRGCWFFKKIPKQFLDSFGKLIADKHIPIFLIKETDEKEIVVVYNGNEIPLRTFVNFLLTNKVKFRPTHSGSKTQEINVRLFKTSCWKCNSIQYAYFIQDIVLSRCGADLVLSDTKVAFNRQIVSAINDFAKANDLSDFHMGPIKSRYSKTAGGKYISFGCYKCDSLFGDWFIRDQIREAKWGHIKTIDFSTIIDNSNYRYEFPSPHWCLSMDKHCEEFDINLNELR